MNLTPKQEKFCLAFIETSNAAEAYRRAYDVSNASAGSVYVNASKLLDNDKVAIRLRELRDMHAKRHSLTVDDLIAELEEARQAALSAESPQTSAAVGATMGKAKLLGMDKQIVDNTSSDGSMTPRVSVSIDKKTLKELAKQIDDEC